MKTIVALVFMVSYHTTNAQDYDFYLQKARQRLAEGDCSRAEASYNTYKDLSHKTNKEIERIIEECKSAWLSQDNMLRGKNFTETAFGMNMEMIYVEGGSFTMGCTGKQGSVCDDDESPNRRTTVGSLYIGMLEVTQSQWEAVMGTTIYQQRNKANSSLSLYGTGSDYPMYYVSWEEAKEFCLRLSLQTGKTYRLPTEAEWEYAASGGNTNEGTNYSGGWSIESVGWYDRNSSHSTHPCGTKMGNALGIYDMSGNVWEWCEDIYVLYSYYDENNPEDSYSYTLRGCHGGGWDSSDEDCQISNSYTVDSVKRYSDLGFRVVLIP